MYRPLLTLCLFFPTAAAVTAQNKADSVQRLPEVNITRLRQGSVRNRGSLMSTETINTRGLTKMACCTLAESFENSAAATVNFSDAVSGAKRIQLLGLSSVYTQVMTENIPSMDGLLVAYGWNFIPPSWLQSVQISKGAASVGEGYESIAGQINLEMKKPNDDDQCYADIYGDADTHFEANATTRFQLSPKLFTRLFLHTTLTADPSWSHHDHDGNGDGFMDRPLNNNIVIGDRWLYDNEEKGVQSRTGFSFVSDRLLGGETAAYMKGAHKDDFYTTRVENIHLNIYNKTGVAVDRKHGGSLGVINSYTRQRLRSRFGRRSYDGDEDIYRATILYSADILTAAGHYTWGANIFYSRPRCFLDSQSLDGYEGYRERLTAGLFAEYTLTAKRLTMTVGAREDRDSRAGWLFTPRLAAKYNITDRLLLRLSAGKGRRASQPVTENTGLMASSRRLVLSENMKMEKAWNFGGNISADIPLSAGRSATLSLDYYRTLFSGQMLADIDRDNNLVYFYNCREHSFSQVFEADLSLTLSRRLNTLLAVRINNNRVTYSDGSSSLRTSVPLVSTLRSLFNLSWASPRSRWVFDGTLQLNGKSRLPMNDGYKSEKTYSPVFPLLFAQMTFNSKRMSVYGGAENILDYKQKNPIISADDPFSDTFDASRIWGPVDGRRLYVGLRLRFGELR